MLFKSQLLTQASGSVGGLTFSHNSAGMYTRARAIPTNPNSAGQVAVRMYFDQAIQMWTDTLTEAQRQNWRDYAANTPVTNKLGDTVNLSGQNMYIRTVIAALRGGLDIEGDYANFTVAPTTFNTGDPGTLSFLTFSAGTDTAVITIAGAPAWAADDLGVIFLQSSLPQNPSVNFYRGPFRGVTSTTGDSGTPITVASIVTDALVPPIDFAAGQKAFLRARVLQSDGRLSTPFILSGLVTA